MTDMQNTQTLRRLLALALAMAVLLSRLTGPAHGTGEEERGDLLSPEATEPAPAISPGSAAAPATEPEPPGPSVVPDPEPAPGPERAGAGMRSMGALGDGGDGGIAALSVSVTPESYQTWTERINGTTPPDLIVSLELTLSEFYTDGGAIKLPIDNLTPTLATHPNFTYGTDGNGLLEPFFEFNTTNTLLADAAKEYDMAEPGAIYIILKDASDPGFQFGTVTIPLHFKFNTNWESKIPGGTILWNVAPTAEFNGDTVVTAASKTIRGSANNALAPTAEYRNPANMNYPGGTIEAGAVVHNDRHYTTMLDPRYENISYIEVPAGSDVSSGFTGYFKDGKTTAADGYDRYRRILNPNPTDESHTDYTYWNYTGIWINHLLLRRTFTPPSMADNATFQFRVGVEYRQVNGPELKPAASARNYKKIARPVWKLNVGTTHSTGDGAHRSVLALADGKIAQQALLAGYPSYGTSSANIGAGSINGVSFVLYQNEPGSEKVNFNSVTLHALRDYGEPDWSRYKVQYEIVDTKGTKDTGDDEILQPLADDVMGVWNPSPSAAAERTINLSLPSLTSTQYINKIIIVPMDTDGNSEGVWPSQNGICLRYVARAWAGQKWPDGTDVPVYSDIKMGWTLYGNDNPDEPEAYPLDYDMNSAYDTYRNKALIEGETGHVYYTDAPFAQAALTSNAGGTLPGSVVNYTVLGYNHSGYTEGDWVEPRIMVRVPRAMELIGTNFTGTDVLENQFGFSAELTYSDTSYNYYSFKAAGYNAPQSTAFNTGNAPVFSFPITFKVASTAKPGTYPLRVIVSDGDPASFIEGSTLYALTKNLPNDGDNITNYGLAQSNGYYMMRGESGPAVTTPLTVTTKADIGVKTTIASLATNGLYVDSTVVPANRGEDVSVRLAVANNGNVSLTKIKLYDILPLGGDSLGSTGSISFVSVTPPSDATVKYTTAAAGTANVPTYGQHGTANPDLQTAAFHSGWTAGNPGTSSDARAIYIDFGARTLAPGESIYIDMVFRVPNNANQTAYNQFRYSGTVAESGAVLASLNSPVSGFSTEAIAIIYNGNLPAANEGGLGAMPPDASSIIGFAPATGAGHDTLTVSSMIPTLTGYIFAGWNTAKDGTGESWAAGGAKTFAGGGSLVLYAQWMPRQYSVTYAPGEHGDFAAQTSQHGYGETTPAAPATPGKPGFSFKNWSPTPSQTVTRDATYTAEWTTDEPVGPSPSPSPPDTPSPPPSLPPAVPPATPQATPTPSAVPTPPPPPPPATETATETETPSSPPALPPVAPVTTLPTPPPPAAPETPRPTPTPTAPGNTLVPSDDGYIEIDEDGTPQGTWTWDGDEWVFEEAPPPLGDVPVTGDDANPAVPAVLFALSIAGMAVSAWQRRRRYRM